MFLFGSADFVELHYFYFLASQRRPGLLEANTVKPA
jgi:hypothetical protein